MNWNPLRKLSLMQRPDLDSQTQNAYETLEKLIAEFESAEAATKSLHQSSKKLLDQILCMGKFETKLTDEITSANLFDSNEYMKSLLEEWHSFAFVVDTIGDEYVIGLQKTLIEPLKQLKHTFTELRAAIRLHESTQLDVIKFQRKVNSYSEKEKTGPNLVKLQEAKQSLENSQKEYARRTQTLANDLSNFLAGSEKLLQPLLEGFIAAEVAWVRACKRALETRSHMCLADAPGSQSLTRQADTPMVGIAQQQQQPAQSSSSERLKNIEDSFRAMGMLSISSEASGK